MATLELDRVGYDYAGGFTALADVSITAAPGEFLSIVGPSGCGKSTLLDLIDGLAKVTSGQIRVDGKPVTAPGPDRAMVFQTAGLLPWRSVSGNIAFALESTGKLSLRNEGRAARKARIAGLIHLVGLDGFADFLPGELSGGMRQRVNLARALAVEPEILLMDEPFANLDAQTRDLMQLELLRIWRETKGTVIFVTHNIQEAVFLGDRVVVMSGRPGGVRRVLDIELSRPRPPEIRREPAFTAYEEQIWKEIFNEVQELP